MPNIGSGTSAGTSPALSTRVIAGQELEERGRKLPCPLFGQPSSYSLNSRELAAEIRRRRREGWQSWEIRARFDFWRAA